MLTVTREQLTHLAPHAQAVYLEAFDRAGEFLPSFGITTALRIAHFMAQILHESGRLTVLTESLNYSVDGLLATFGTKRVPRELAERICRTADHKADQPAIAEALYGGTWGTINLGNNQPGDGWRFRGHGLPQLTGRANFRHMSKLLGAVDLEAQPEATLDPRYALLIALLFWQDRHCAELADRDDLVGVRKRWNGGTIGLDETRALLAELKAIYR